MEFGWLGYARDNLLRNLIKQDEYVVYADTDSLKLKEGYNQKYIDEYNKQVEEKIRKVCNELEIDFESYKPKDIKGKEHLIGLFENDGNYDYFIEQGAKKYAYIDSEDKEIHIVVSGVPKKGRIALKKLEDFKDDFVFDFKDTNKLMLMYNDFQETFELEDYQGNKELIKDRYGCSLVPITYKLGKSIEYSDLLSSEYSERSRFKEG